MTVFKCTACPGGDPCVLYDAGNYLKDTDRPIYCPVDGGPAPWEYLDPEVPA
jgi:hypothetical protein